MNTRPPHKGMNFASRRDSVVAAHREMLMRSNFPAPRSNGTFQRWQHPVVTADHIPLDWRYDFSPERNPYFAERLAVNAAFNAGALYRDGKHWLMVRVEGADRKSFFALASSKTGVDQFTFTDTPVVLGEVSEPDTNVYDMRLTEHADGWIYGLFCTERKDPELPEDTSAAIAQCGIVRSRDLITWERLPDLITKSRQQRNVVLHPEFVDGKYALYTRPQDGFITVGKSGGIGWALLDDMTNPVVDTELVIDPKVYHTIKELKNGQGPAPLRSEIGWLHLAHGVRNTAAGLRYVLYMFVTAPDDPRRVTHRPGGAFIVPEGGERVGDVSNVVFSNGWTRTPEGEVFIYYASSDTRLHVATTSIGQLVDYCLNTPEDPLTSAGSVQQRLDLIAANKALGA